MDLPLEEERIDTGAARLNAILPEDIRVFGFRRTTRHFHSQKDCCARTYTYTMPTFAFAKSDQVHLPIGKKKYQLTNASFRLPPETLDEVRDVLGIYVGTHNFFNYTSGLYVELL